MRTPSSVKRGTLPGGFFLSMMACLCFHAIQAAGAAPEGGLELRGEVPPVPADIVPAAAEPAAEATPTQTQSGVESPTEVFSGPLVGAATDPQRYFVFDALAMQRNNALKDGPLVVENVTPQFTALQTNMLQSTVAPGVRLLYGDYGCDGVGWETGYLGLWNMYSRARMESPTSLLQAPGGLGFASPPPDTPNGAVDRRFDSIAAVIASRNRTTRTAPSPPRHSPSPPDPRRTPNRSIRIG
jgi:hypothetical protein